MLLAAQLNVPHVFTVLGFRLALQVSIMHTAVKLSQGSDFCGLDPELRLSLAVEFQLRQQSKWLLCSV